LILTTDKIYAEVQPNQKPVNFQDIRKYAKLSSAAYQTLPNLRKNKLLKDSPLTHHNIIPDIKISYFLITNDVTKTHDIAVRGTDNIENTFVNFSLKLTLDKKIGVRFHSGFLQAAQAIYSEIKSKIEKDYIINTTGHSLGGAVALILAMLLDSNNFKIGQVVTFGQPKVTNITGAYKFKHLNIIRIVTPKDLVPLIPFMDPMDINNLDIYWHQGKEIILLQDNTYAVLEGVNSMLRATRFTQEQFNEKNINNHQMSHYLIMLNKKIPDAKLVPFKNSFNLFNLFGK